MTDNDPATPLLAERARTVVRITELADAFDAIVESSETANLDDEHDPEGSTVGFERAQVSALLADARTRLVEIDDAFERLRHGRYGICTRCGQAIPAARLEARPATRLCVRCASR